MHAAIDFTMRAKIVRDLGIGDYPYHLLFERGWKWVRGGHHIKSLLVLLLKEGQGFT